MTDLITIRRFGHLAEALMAKGCLDSAGIECFLADANMAWLDSPVVRGMRLQVARLRDTRGAAWRRGELRGRSRRTRAFPVEAAREPPRRAALLQNKNKNTKSRAALESRRPVIRKARAACQALAA